MGILSIFRYLWPSQPKEEDFSQVVDIAITGMQTESCPGHSQCFLIYAQGQRVERWLLSTEVNRITEMLGRGKYYSEA